MARKTKTPEVVQTPRIAREIDREKLQDDLRAATGFDLYVSRSQGQMSVQYGYARIEIFGYGVYTHALGVCEGSDSKEELVFEYDSFYSTLIAWATEILRTGRTTMCGPGINLHNRLRSNPPEQACDYPWSAIVDMINGIPIGGNPVDPLILQPDYQRGSVWTLQQQMEFVGFLLEGGDCPKIVIQRYESKKNAPLDRKEDYWRICGEVVDGQQRLIAIYHWMNGMICGLSPETGEKLWYKDTDEIDRRGLSLKIHWIDVPRAERIRFYIKLNTGGTMHTAAEIANARALLAKEKQS